MIESYASYEDYLAWLEKRKITVTQTETEIDAALYIATNDYIDVKYAFKGKVTDEDQDTSLPTDLVSINRDVVRVTCECAYLHLSGKLFNDDLDPNGAIKSLSTNDKLSVLGEAKSVEYFNSRGQTYLRSHPQIDRVLAPYLSNNGNKPSLGYAL